MSVCERCTENGNCAWQNHDETICRENPAFPITNADRIRAMSDEELAEYINDVHYLLDEKPGMCDVCYHDSVQNCKECRLDWLKQEADNVK